VAIYGNFLSGRESLFANPRPDTVYGREKLQMERLLRIRAKQHSMKCTILRVGHVYGPGLAWSETIFELVDEDGFRLPFDGQLASNAVSIWNVIAGIREILHTAPEPATFNLTDSPQTTWRDIFNLHSQASGATSVEALSAYESERLFRDGQRWAETGMAARVAHETWRWIRHLPASYISSVPSLKFLAQRAVARFASKSLEAKLWAINCKRFAQRTELNTVVGIPPIFCSERVPGPCLKYQAGSPAEHLTELRDWYEAISTPLGSADFTCIR
jgi:hypothetical protein